MKGDNYKDGKNTEDQAIWDLLGKASDSQPLTRFVDDTVRMVRNSPEASALPFYRRFTFAAPVFALAACGVIGVWLTLLPVDTSSQAATAAQPEVIADWSEIEDEAEIEVLIAAADYLDQFSDQELITLIGL